ncbi:MULTISPECIES: holo-ACP synthase [Sinorhizobium]|uniref:Holo-[acyl-carrier-protein] synthase n=1 Tax=Sinorhizobium americanum TaxID=194963 RepID=A0A2S3YQG3_9HYPH|nr:MULTISPECIES: holo-ACP synthase [Sinorhizobium]PDT34466.1 holo-[acyl-carrier-protein] synthase [Sinorhizobium sp. FG01]POH33473.1 hypothetical protein ATY31_10605 [Sinorhizobium americanum]
MIVGIGADLIEVERIADALAHRGDRFVARFCTDAEQLATPALAPASYYATVFAVKEAVLKALGTGISRWVSWHDINISVGPIKICIELEGGAKRRLSKLGGGEIHCCIGGSKAYVQAFVLIEQAPFSRIVQAR